MTTLAATISTSAPPVAKIDVILFSGFQLSVLMS
jgi:hypothetical protein